jgi:hypothetical protein
MAIPRAETSTAEIVALPAGTTVVTPGTKSSTRHGENSSEPRAVRSTVEAK